LEPRLIVNRLDCLHVPFGIGLRLEIRRDGVVVERGWRGHGRRVWLLFKFWVFVSVCVVLVISHGW